MLPEVNSQKDSAFNQMTVQLNKLIKLQHGYLSRIDSIGAQMRDEITVIVEIAEAQFKILENLLSQSPDERDFVAAVREYQETLQRGSRELVEGLESLLAQRNGLMENGKVVPLTEEKKLALINSFTQDVERKMNSTFQFTLDANSDLERLQRDAKKVLNANISLHDELLRLKTGITEKLNHSTTQNAIIEESRVGVYSKESIDIWHACQEGKILLLKDLIKEKWVWQVKNFVNQQSGDGWTGLTLAAAYGHKDCLILLLEKGANPNLADKLGYCPLHWASKKGHKRIAIELIGKGATVDAPGEYGRTPLDMAVFNGQGNMVKLLLNKGANVNAQNSHGCSLLHIAIEQGHLGVVLELIRSPILNVNLCDSNKQSPLYYAISLGRTDIAALIVGHPQFKTPTDPNDPNSFAKLRLIKPAQNAEGVQKFLNKY